MKPVYIDITNIPELRRYTGISRVTSEVAVKLIRDGVNVRLLAYSVPDHAYRLVDSDRFILMLNGLLPDRNKCYTDKLIAPDELEEGSVFFEINSTWHTMPNRSWLLPRLKNRRIRIICLIHDIIPIRDPQYMARQTLLRFMEFLTAHLTYDDEILVTTETVKNDIIKLFGELDLPEKPIAKIPLGADFSADKGNNDIDETIDPEIEKLMEGRRFILSVGTIEPRKNQTVLVDAYKKHLAAMGVDLVLVGHIGWEMESLMKRIETDRHYNKGLFALTDVNDATLQYLYSRAFMVAFPSFTEGYGLPTIEALINGIPIACSDIGVMREVGGDFADYFDPKDPNAFAAIVKRYVDSPELYAEKRRHIAEDYDPPKWADTVAAYENLIFGKKSEENFPHKPIKQIVFLSARPAPILATLPYIEEFMPFIKELVVCCPDFMAGFMKENYSGRLKLTTVTDDELLAGRTLPPDHSTRNFFLRCLAMELDVIDDEFIMCDDDYRPMRTVTEDFYYRDGRYRGYYFSDISRWQYQISKLFSYDYCHFRTLGFLKSHGYPTLQYSSHMPQVINKKWYLEMIRKYPDIITKGYDEWSTYFNYISAEHRDQYQPCPYVTLSWPNIGGAPLGVVQPEYVFENFYSDNYEFKREFAKCTPVLTEREYVLEDNEKKIVSALRYKTEYMEGMLRDEEFEKEYETEYSDKPYFSAYFSGTGSTVPELGAPCRLKLSRNRINTLRFSVSRAYRTEANGVFAVFELVLRDSSGKEYLRRNVEFQQRLEYAKAAIKLSEDVPGDTELSLEVSARLVTRSSAAKKIIPVELTD